MIALLFAAAVALFVLSLPVARTELGANLRRTAGLCFVLALLPSLIFGLFFQPSAAIPGQPNPIPLGSRIAGGLSCLGALVILSLSAYAVLAVRKKLFRPKKDPWETFFPRGGGKRRVRPADDDREVVE